MAGVTIRLVLVAAGAFAASLGPSARTPAAPLPPLRPEAAAAWQHYVAATEARIDRDLSGPRAPIPAGQIRIESVTASGAAGEPLDVPHAMVHHWRGVVFLPGAELDDLLRRLAGGEPGTRQSDVLAARVLDRRSDGLRLFLRVQRQKFVTVVYDTEHAVTFTRHHVGLASTASRAIRINEISGAGTPSERALGDGEDRGFLWRWHAYWRYEQVPGGVLAECESVSLSRSVPAVVRLLAGRLIRTTARESMERTLATFSAVFSRAADPAPKALDLVCHTCSTSSTRAPAP